MQVSFIIPTFVSTNQINNMDSTETILLAIARIVQYGTPGTVKHSANQFDDRLEFTAEVEGRKLLLYFTQSNYSLLIKAEGNEVTNVNYHATLFVDGVRAFANARCGINVIRDAFSQVKFIMERDKAAYFTDKQAYDFLYPAIEPGTNIDMPEPNQAGDSWNHSFQGQFVKFDKNRGLAVVRDGDNDHWDIEPHRLIISEDQD